MVTHIVGGALGVIATVLCVIFSAIHHDLYALFSSIVFGLSLIILYTTSSIYHGLSPNLTAKKVFQIFDHCSIFILIAGSYTPFALCTLRQYDTVLGWTIFGIVWFFAILGIILNSIDIKKYKIFSMICYIAMGWCIIVKANILPQLLGNIGFLLLLWGGIAYTIGALFYILGKQYKWQHSLFHIFCVIGSLLQFLCVLLFVI